MGTEPTLYGPLVHATVCSSHRQNPISTPDSICFGDGHKRTQIRPPQNPPPTPAYWYYIVDLSMELGLAAQVNTISQSNDAVPDEVTSFIQNTASKAVGRYFMFCVALGQNLSSIPQGPLASFLRDLGSGHQLQHIEQALSQAGTGTFNSYSYVLGSLVGQPDNAPSAAQEVASLWTPSALTMQFAMSKANGFRYAPVHLAAQ